MSQYGIPFTHRHHRSESREMNLIMDLAWSSSPEPYGSDKEVSNGSPYPNASSPFPSERRPSKSPSSNTSTAAIIRLTAPPAESVPNKSLSVLPISPKLYNKMASPNQHLEPSSRSGTPDGKNMQMSLVSPPFTPSASQLDLVANHLQNGTTGDIGEPLDLTKSETKAVRSKLDERLPNVFCESRARIPTTNGTEIFLHVYRNDVDTKEHLAIVFGSDIHSKTLFAYREGETEHDRMTRGAYTGKLYPGRTTSTAETEQHEPEETKKHETDQHETDQHDDTSNTPSKAPPADVLCRIHSECYTGETAWSARCDCGEQLDEAARLMAEEGQGVIVYLRQEGRGIGLGEKLKAYNLQDLGADTVQANLMLRHPADGRSFGLATAILKDLGLDHIRLMTNNPDKIVAVEGKHKEITVTQRVPMIPLSWQKKGGFHSAEVDKYLATKIERMGHLLER